MTNPCDRMTVHPHRKIMNTTTTPIRKQPLYFTARDSSPLLTGRAVGCMEEQGNGRAH